MILYVNICFQLKLPVFIIESGFFICLITVASMFWFNLNVIVIIHINVLIFSNVNHLPCIIISIIIITTIIIIFIIIITLIWNTDLSLISITCNILEIKKIFMNKYAGLILDRWKFYILKWKYSFSGTSILFINVMEHIL